MKYATTFEKVMLLIIVTVIPYCMFINATYESAKDNRVVCESRGGEWYQDAKPFVPISGECK